MTDQYIGLDEPGTIDKKVDGEELVVGANTVIRERIQVAGAAAAAIAAVLNSAPSTEYGVVTRNIPSGTQPVSATDLDIRNLVAATDIVDLGGNALTALQLIDDIVHALNGALNKAVAIAGQLDDTSPTAATEDNVAPLRITAQRAAHVNLRNVSGTEIGTAGAPVRTDPTGTTTQPVSATDLDVRNLDPATDKVAARVRNAADSGYIEPSTLGEQQTQTTALQLIDDVVHSGDAVLSKYAVVGAVLDDTTPATVTENQAHTLRMTPERSLHVELRTGANEAGTSGNPVRTDPTGTTTQPVSGTVTASQATASSLNAEVQGDAAHDAAVSGNPVLIGGYSETPGDSAPGNQVTAEGEATRFAVDRDGALYTHPHPPRIWHTTNKYTTQQTDTSIKAAEASVSHYITDIVIMCNAAVTVTIEEGTATARFEYYASGQGDGVAHAFTTPIKLAANTAITVTTSAAVTVFIVVNGYTAP